MWSYARSGWSFARRSWFLLFLLFLYQYGWGFAIFSWVKRTVVPLLYRYPGGELPDSAVRLFWMEAEFQLTKTALAAPYIWTLLALLAARMLITPLVNAGIYSVLSADEGSPRKRFFQGARRHVKPFLLLYALQMLLTFAPLLWAVPRIMAAAAGAVDWTQLAAMAAPYVLGWLAYQGALDLAFMYAGFGIVDGTGALRGAAAFARRALPAAMLALAIFTITFAVSSAAAVLTVWWAGFFAVVIHQSFPLVRALLKLWAIGTQYRLWKMD